MSEITQARAKVILKGKKITDEVQQDLDDMVTTTFEKNTSRTINDVIDGVGDDASEERLWDEALSSASDVNNLGPEGQVAWLLVDGFNEADIMRHVFSGPEHKKAPVSLSLMDTSTGHLSIPTRIWMDDKTNQSRFSIMSRDEGYMLSTYLGSEEEWRDKDDIPHDLLHVLRYAAANSQDWVLFDMDAERDLNLPWYEDMKGKPAMPHDLHSSLLIQNETNGVWSVDPDVIGQGDLGVPADRLLDDENFQVPEGEGVWLTVAGVSMRIKDHEDDVTVTVFVNGFEMDDPLSEVIIYGEDVKAERAMREAVNDTPDAGM
jgi:hypothetical protein